MQTNRRLLLLTLGLTIFSNTACARENSKHSKDKNKKSVLIIGAGLAGLAAGRELQNAGYKVKVLEARDRIGGRIWTSNKWSDAPIDLGASWIHGTKGNPLSKIADEIGAKRIKTDYENSITFQKNGKEITPILESQIDELRDEIYRLLEKAQSQDDDQTIAKTIAPLLQKFSPISDEYQYINFIINSEMEQEYAGAANEMSAQFYDAAKEFDGEDVLFEKGFNLITNHLARDLEIKLQTVVNEINWQNGKAIVKTNKGEFSADKAIVTLPIGVLKAKKVKFVPELPKEKLKAIENIGMGILNKCYLRFEECFWDDDVDWLEYIGNENGAWSEWVSFQRAANLPVLLGFNAAKNGKAIESQNDNQIIASAMQTLKTIFGPNIPNPIDFQITRWASDPFAMGSYSFNKIGVNEKTRKSLAMPLAQTLYFAGEATDEYFGTAHGAFLSGIRAAGEIIKS